MLTMTFLGVGGAFARRNFQSNVLIEAWNDGPGSQLSPDDSLLIDFGATGPSALYAMSQRPEFEYLRRDGQLFYPAIRKIFITHLHADHIGGLEEIALMNRFVNRRDETERPFKPQLIGHINVLLNLWDHCLKGGLSGIPGRYAMIQDYFFTLALNLDEPETGRFTLLKRYEFKIFQTDHVMIQRKYDWPSFGLLINDRKNDESVFFSGDTRFDYPVYAPMLTGAKHVFHDVQLINHPSPVHALITELQTMPTDIKRKTTLYHFGDDWDQGPYDFVREEFAGFAEQHKRIVLFE